MFTGIIERSCPLVEAHAVDGRRRLRIDLGSLREPPPDAPAPNADGEPDRSGSAGAGAAGPRAASPDAPLVAVGDSVAIHGVCLTVAALEGDVAAFDVVPETLKLTNLGPLQAGDRVHVERSLRFGQRVDGHLVQGHVEGTGEVLASEPADGEVRVTIRCGPGFGARCLPKGSVTVDGISLTIAELHADRFTVALVPHTLAICGLGDRHPGDRVNLEADLIGQWVLRAVRQVLPGSPTGVPGTTGGLSTEG